jgi:geranylgeranyl diphosphate synthase type I
MTSRKAEKLSGFVIEELQNRSRKGLEFARKTFLTEKIEYERLRKALEHYVQNWNDFTHAGLFSLACEAVGGTPDNFVNTQTAVSMIAAAFDVHDDIIDQSKRKHDVPTVFGKYGRDIALLLGDAFLIKGLTVFYISINHCTPDKVAEIVGALQKSLFEVGNAHGFELSLKGRSDVGREEYMRLVEMKAASIEADMRIGGIIGEGSDKEVETLAKYGRVLGILATLREEFIDIFETEELNQRLKGKALPIPVLLALHDPESRAKIQRLIKRNITDESVENLLNIVLKSTSVVKLRKYMLKLSAKATALTSQLPNQEIAQMLRLLPKSALEDL